MQIYFLIGKSIKAYIPTVYKGCFCRYICFYNGVFIDLIFGVFILVFSLIFNVLLVIKIFFYLPLIALRNIVQKSCHIFLTSYSSFCKKNKKKGGNPILDVRMHFLWLFIVYCPRLTVYCFHLKR